MHVACIFRVSQYVNISWGQLTNLQSGDAVREDQAEGAKIAVGAAARPVLGWVSHFRCRSRLIVHHPEGNDCIHQWETLFSSVN